MFIIHDVFASVNVGEKLSLIGSILILPRYVCLGSMLDDLVLGEESSPSLFSVVFSMGLIALFSRQGWQLLQLQLVLTRIASRSQK